MNNQILIIDNASSDRTVAEVKNLIRELGGIDINLLQNYENLGLGRATCQAEARAKGDLILVANPDITFTTGLGRLLEYSEKHPRADWMMPVLNSSEKGVYYNAPHWHRYPFFTQFAFLVYLDRRLNGFLTKSCSGGRYGEDVLSGSKTGKSYGASCMLLSRRLLERIGGIYKPEYFLYWADADLVRRLASSGAKPHYVAEASVDHFGGYSSSKVNHTMQTFLSAKGKGQLEKDWGHATRFFLFQFLDAIFVAVSSKLGFGGGFLNKIVFLKGLLA